MRTFSASEVAELTGWSEKSLRNALERESYAPRAGKGVTRYEFSLLDVCDAAVVRRLVDVGFPIALARDQARAHVNRLLRSARNFADIASLAQGHFLEIMIDGDHRESRLKSLSELGPFFEPPPLGHRLKSRFGDGSTALVLHLGEVFERLYIKARSLFGAEFAGGRGSER